jgi:large subunit ribosomal protein L21
MSYAIVRTGGKQYRVEQGQSLLVERLPADDGAKVALEPLLYVDGDTVLDGAELSKVGVEATIVGHERGPKLRVVKFKPKRGYKRRTGHRQELTRIEVTQIKLGAGGRSRKAAEPEPEPEVASEDAPKPVAAEATPEPVAVEATPEPVAVEATPEPVAVEETPEPVAVEATPEPVAAEPPAAAAETQTTTEEAGNGA